MRIISSSILPLQCYRCLAFSHLPSHWYPSVTNNSFPPSIPSKYYFHVVNTLTLLARTFPSLSFITLTLYILPILLSLFSQSVQIFLLPSCPTNHIIYLSLTTHFFALHLISLYSCLLSSSLWLPFLSPPWAPHGIVHSSSSTIWSFSLSWHLTSALSTYSNTGLASHATHMLSWQGLGSNLWPCGLKARALPTELPWHIMLMLITRLTFSSTLLIYSSFRIIPTPFLFSSSPW